MNVAQRDRLLKIIVNDCRTRGAYIRPDGRTCAIGAMMVDCNLPLPKLYAKANKWAVATLDDHILDTLQSVYGIRTGHLVKIQYYNDKETTSRRRRASISSFIMAMTLSE